MSFLVKTKLHAAVLERDLAKVRELIAAGEDINTSLTINENTLLHYASTLDITEELLANGVNVNARNVCNETPLYSAITEGKDFSIIKALLLSGAEVKIRTTTYENTLLHFATNAEVAKELLLYGADMNALNVYEETPLHYAVKNRNLGVVKTLLSAGADVNRKNTDGYTPLHFAARYGQKLAVIQELLKYGALINEKNVCGYTPLHLASVKSDVLLVRELLSQGANVNERTNEGNTPLFDLLRSYYSFSEDKLEVIKELLEYGADINIETYTRSHTDIGRTSIAIALQESEEAAKVIIKMIVLKNYDQNYKKILNIDEYNYDSRFDHLKLFTDDCGREIARMKKHLFHNMSLNDLVIKKIVKPVFESDNILTHEIAIEYPIYQDIILPFLKLCLERGELFDKFRELQVCSVQEMSSEHKQYVCLNPDCMNQIAECLSNNDLSSFIFAMNSGDGIS